MYEGCMYEGWWWWWWNVVVDEDGERDVVVVVLDDECRRCMLVGVKMYVLMQIVHGCYVSYTTQACSSTQYTHSLPRRIHTIPTHSPAALNTGPPLLPELIAAVCGEYVMCV